MPSLSSVVAPRFGADAALPEWLRGDTLSVPMLPAVAQRVIELAASPDLGIHLLSGLVAKDPVLAGRVMGLANSAYSSPSRPITGLTEAIVRLGTTAVRNVVITVSFTSRLQDPALYEKRGKPLMDHALGSAYMARLVAERARMDPQETFLAGLLHDIGKLVILKRAHEYRRQKGHAIPESELEEALIRHHPAAGGLVLRQWKLPDTLDEPVLYHHDYEAATEYRRETAIVYLANRLSHRYGFGCAADASDLLADPVAEFLGIDAAWLEATDARAPGLYNVARELIL